ncbi:MAG: sigma 54-interacting transcriptional regulator, partial [bacterium]
PPFWQTWLFRISTLFSIILVAFGWYRKRMGKIEKRKKDLEIQVKDKTLTLHALQNALDEVERLRDRFQAESVYLQDEIKLEHNFENIISRSESFKKILHKVEQVAATDATVLILGESGTGKELLARAIHNISDRGDRPLVKVNCSALPGNLIESELFGHEKGAYTGAVCREIGRFELADSGTIFLDEIGDIPLELQAKLLRVLQEGEFERLGNPKTIKVDVRVITATNRDLEKEIENGSFREDLYYRLNVFPINIPPLRERKEDIPLLVNYFLKKYTTKIGKRIDTITQNVIDTLQSYHWPGNVRELENVIERSVIISQGKKLALGDWLPKTIGTTNNSHISTLEENERRHIIRVLEMTNWRISGEKGAATILGINSKTLDSRIKKLNIKRNNKNF